jgi:hypothetical protein
MSYDIFVSYRRTDRELVAKVVTRLEQRGVSVWYDAEIEGGADWRETIVEALTNSGMMVVFFSDACNDSRQLKKELAVADSLEKPVAPILIEDTRPKGAYLYELADRNWIHAWPDPASKVEQLADLLAGLAGKTKDTASTAGKLSDAYVGRTGVGYAGGQKKKPSPTRDILPFKWIDLAVLVPLLGGFVWYLQTLHAAAQTPADVQAMSTIFFCVLALALYTALVFPFRYYLRRTPIRAALGKYLISTAILYALFMAGFLIAWSRGLYPAIRPGEIALVLGVVWLVFTIIAFLIYGLLAGQRAVRAFRSNLKKI